MKRRRSLHMLAKMKVKNQCQLITYPDCFGGNFKGLKYVLDNYFKGVVGGVHILPFYPSSADRGFAPLTYEEVVLCFVFCVFFLFEFVYVLYMHKTQYQKTNDK